MLGKDCPMCSEVMQVREREITDRVPGMAQTKTTKYYEWICPECEYFEEVDDEDMEE